MLERVYLVGVFEFGLCFVEDEEYFVLFVQCLEFCEVIEWQFDDVVRG